MKIYFAILAVSSVLLTGVLCIEPYPAPAQVDLPEQEQQRPQRPERPSLFEIFSNYPGSSIIEVPFNGFGQRWRGLEAMMRYMDTQMMEMMSEMEALIPIDREREEWCMAHPVVTESNGTRIMRLTLDMRQFKAEEISVKVRDNVLYVEAKQESRTGSSLVFRQYTRQFVLPEGVDVEALRSTLSPEGVLTITAPMVDEEGTAEEEDVEGDEQQEEQEETEEEEEEEQEVVTTTTPTTTPIPVLPELPAEHVPEPDREKKEEAINIIHE